MISLVDMLIADEGLELKPYRDTVGKLTIGVGRNLDDVGISHAEALGLLQNDITHVRQLLGDVLPWYLTLSPLRQLVIENMCFNLGLRGLLTFQTTLGLIRSGQYAEAARHMRLSKWAHQVGERATRLASLMEHNQEPEAR